MTASANAPVSAGAARGRAPDFFIVGHAKSGTSAMYRMLTSNPRIHMPQKEPAFFIPELRTLDRYQGGVGDYLSLFDEAKPEQLIGDATPWYLLSPAAALRIAELQPRARIIAILREPASFLRSLHLQNIRSEVETEPDFRKALELEQARSEGRHIPRTSTRPQLLMYSQHVRYVEQLRRFDSVFPRDQMLVLIYEDFRADNAATVRLVQRFLGVEDGSPIAAIEANPAAGVRSPRLNAIVRSLYLGSDPPARAIKSAIKSVTSQSMRHRAIATVRRLQADQPPPPDLELMRELRVRFKDEVIALSEYLDRDMLSFWKYDQGLD